MSAWALCLSGAGLLILLGMLAGVWIATGHFRLLLDDEQDKIASCRPPMRI
ncbi:hypothetical protein [Pseudomonas tructae]|uniref:hypothetical protein n=1 Tax=Pseudomonas tructae TaxID=2518644 RepID=UPI0013EEE74E|nr:hypothetical protein [Pseudomonas tructae]